MLTLLRRVRGLGNCRSAKTIIDLTLYLVSGILIFIRNETLELQITIGVKI